jgi:PPM family protein phosphatase
MHPFQENLQTWFSRKLPSRTQNQCNEIPFILSSDVGLVRKENQDRVAALYTGKKTINPLFAIAVADGMGGMREGGLCSTLALSSFFYALVQHRNLSIKERASEAIKASNNQVFNIYEGNGGSTLTAILVDSHGEKIFVHIGDTRIYTFGFNKKTERQTIDDSLAEAVGGTGRDLLQFVGMGESMQPQIADLSHIEDFCAITTDGIHGIEEKTLNRIFENSSDIKQASERISAVARWCGGNDNSTSAIFDMGEISAALAHYESSGVRLWDAGGDLTTLWLREEDQAFNCQNTRTPSNQEESQHPSPPPNEPATGSQIKKPLSSTKRSRKKKNENTHSEKIQLDIEIGNSEEKGDVDAD